MRVLSPTKFKNSHGDTVLLYDRRGSDVRKRSWAQAHVTCFIGEDGQLTSKQFFDRLSDAQLDFARRTGILEGLPQRTTTDILLAIIFPGKFEEDQAKRLKEEEHEDKN